MREVTRSKWLVVAAFAVGTFSLIACQLETPVEGPQATPIRTAEREQVVLEVTRVIVEERIVAVEPAQPAATPRPKHLVICMSEEPETLYWYGSQSTASRAVYHALYENNITRLGYGYQARGIEQLPTIANGAAVIQTVRRMPGELVVDVDDDIVAWADGVAVTAANGEIVRFSGEPVEMPQLVVRFKLKARRWSDGVSVTALDSIFSFSLAADPDTPASKYVIERTESYAAIDELTVEWRGMPGFLHREYSQNFWQPLPRHLLDGRPAVELIVAADSTSHPVGDGPFVLAEWVHGSSIRLERNRDYYRSQEGQPRLDGLTFKFIADENQLLAQMLAGQCDVATQDAISIDQAPFLVEAQRTGALVPYFQTGTVFEHIDFNVDPLDRPERGGNHTVWFEDVRVRQAMIMCTDRQALVDEILFGRSEVMHGYVPTTHPLFASEATIWPYDPERANALLDEAGFVDTDGDGWRNHHTTGEKFSVTLGSRDGFAMVEQVVRAFQEDMTACGIEIVPYALPVEEWYALGAGAPLFGRLFDLGEFAWPTDVEPLCDLYLSDEIPGPPDAVDDQGNRLWPAGWGGANETGWSSAAFDTACMGAQTVLPGTAEYARYHEVAQRVFSEAVPVIPLFLRLKVAAVRPSVLHFHLDVTEPSELYNLYEIDLDAD